MSARLTDIQQPGCWAAVHTGACALASWATASVHVVVA